MKAKGFTLLELMIALGVAAVIATFAMPSYRLHVAKGHRMDAAAALYRAAQYVENTRNMGGGDASSRLPAGFDQAPANGTPVYRLRLTGESESNGGYSIAAEPVQPGDECGVFILDATGVRANRLDETLSSSKVAACWGQK
jgi:type IV pilus assembly protein PilE